MVITKHSTRVNHLVGASFLNGRQGNPLILNSTIHSAEHAKAGKQTAKANQDPVNKNKATEEDTQKKTIMEIDEELKQKMSGLSGDGGAAGIEYEDGKPVAMKRSVKNNIFRYI